MHALVAKASLLFFLSCWLLGCAPDEKQHVVESQVIFGILRLLPIFEHSHPGVQMTNLAQVVAGLDRDYPYGWHEQLLRFGKRAGFSNSIYEKYVFFPPGLTNRLFEGELVMMNAEPYPDAAGEMGRTLISKEGGVFFRQSIREARVQQLFKDGNVLEPKPMPMPPPPAPPDRPPMPVSAKVSRFFMRVADFVGLSGHWLTLRNATFLTSLAAMLVMGGFLWASRSRR